MEFTETKIKKAFIIEPRRFEDERGFLAPAWRQRDFAARGIEVQFVEANISFSRKCGTLRGMHYQSPPHAQAKLVRCTAGAIYDVIIDLRRESPTFRQWIGVELTADNRRLLYVPEGCAHGFQTLEDDTEVFYQMSDVYAPEYAGGARWNDPAFGIEWPPTGERVIVARDQEYPDFTL